MAFNGQALAGALNGFGGGPHPAPSGGGFSGLGAASPAAGFPKAPNMGGGQMDRPMGGGLPPQANFQPAPAPAPQGAFAGVGAASPARLPQNPPASAAMPQPQPPMSAY